MTEQIELKTIEYGSQFWNKPMNDNFKAAQDFMNQLAKNGDFDYHIVTVDEMTKLNSCRDAWALVIKTDKFCIVAFAAMMPVIKQNAWIDAAKLPQNVLGNWAHTENLIGNRYQSAMNPANGQWKEVTVNGQLNTDGTIQVYMCGQDGWACGYQGLAFLHN